MDRELSAEEKERETALFLESFVFMRLGQAISKGQWETAMITLRNMEQKVKKLELPCFDKEFAGLRQAILNKNIAWGKQIMTSVTARRVRMREAQKTQ